MIARDTMCERGPEHRHLVGGLRLCSDLPLPALPADFVGEGDGRLRFGPLPPHEDAVPGEVDAVVSPRKALIWNHLDERYLVREGREIVLDRPAGPLAPHVHDFLVGPLFTLLFLQRGLVPLHGSAVLVGDRAHVFMGPSGGGKSTMAGLVLAAGALPLADDTVVLEEREGRFLVHPAFLDGKLDEAAADAARALGGTVGPSAHPAGNLFRVETPLPGPGPWPLAAVHVLGLEGDEEHPLPAPRGLEVLLGQIQGRRFALERHHRPRLLATLHALAVTCPLFRLPRRESLALRGEDALALRRRWSPAVAVEGRTP